METIDMSPSWGEWGILYLRLAYSNEQKAIRHLQPDMAQCFATMQAYNKLVGTLPPELYAQFEAIRLEELAKLSRALGDGKPVASTAKLEG